MDKRPVQGPDRQMNPRQAGWGMLGLLLLYGAATAGAARCNLWCGAVLAVLGAAVLSQVAARRYQGLVRQNLELDRACRTRLLEKYLSGDVPPEGDLTEAMPGVESEYFAVAALPVYRFFRVSARVRGRAYPPYGIFAGGSMDAAVYHTAAPGISLPYFVPMVDGMEILINVTGLEEENLDSSSRDKLREICRPWSWPQRIWNGWG